ncbi:MAG: radical SAM protein [Lentisphaerae bacterium]|nr:radical SAM protein [Lentisphaerota bacterium]
MKAESIFFDEWLATNRDFAQLSISAVCNSRCIFCSNRQNPFAVTSNIFRDLADIKLQLSLMLSHYAGPIRLSDSLPGRISEGEAFLHPDFFKILELIRRRFLTNPLCFTTNGSMLDATFLKNLAQFRPIELTVSMHSTRPELWAYIFKKKESDALRALNALALIREHRLSLIGAIVTLPELCGWRDLERTYANFVAQGAKSTIIWWPGYTKHAPPEMLRDLQCPLADFTDFVARMRRKHPIPLLAMPDMRAPPDIAIKTIMNLTLCGNLKNAGGHYRQVIWLTSQAAAERLAAAVKAQAPAFANCHQVFPVKNETYGGNIFCAGLLQVGDFIQAGRAALVRWPAADLFLVPAVAFDDLLRDLQKVPAYRIAEELNRPCWVVGNDGSAHSLLTRGFGRDRGDQMPELKRLLANFNAAGGGRGKIKKTKANPVAQRFELLDRGHALCIQTCSTQRDNRTMKQWIFLAKKNGQWKITRTMTGKTEQP